MTSDAQWCHDDHCLACDRRFDNQDGTVLYCSPECYTNDLSNSLVHCPPPAQPERPTEPPREATPTDYARIHAWRESVSPGPPSLPSSSRSKFSLPTVLSPSRPSPPTLTPSSTPYQPARRPSSPIPTPHYSEHKTTGFQISTESLTMTTTYTRTSESIPTPYSGSPTHHKHSRFDAVATHPSQSAVVVNVFGRGPHGALAVPDEDLLLAPEYDPYTKGDQMLCGMLGGPPKKQRPLPAASDLASRSRGRKKVRQCH